MEFSSSQKNFYAESEFLCHMIKNSLRFFLNWISPMLLHTIWGRYRVEDRFRTLICNKISLLMTLFGIALKWQFSMWGSNKFLKLSEVVKCFEDYLERMVRCDAENLLQIASDENFYRWQYFLNKAIKNFTQFTK